MNICLYDEETEGLLATYCTQQGHTLLAPPTTATAATVDQQPTWLSQADVVIVEASLPSYRYLLGAWTPSSTGH